MFKDLFANIRTISHQVNLTESLVKLIPTDNPQVSGYLPPAAYNIPPDVYTKLLAFKEKLGLESVEMAVTVILEEYFAFTQTPINSRADTTSSRLEILESKCSSLTETVAELTRAIAHLQASNSQPVDYQGTQLHQQSPPPLQDKGAAVESLNSPSVDQGESLEPAGVDGLLGNQSESEQLLTLKVPSNRQFANNRSVEYSEASELTGEIASTNGSTDIELELPPGVQGHSNLEQQDGETFSTPMTQADLAKRLGVATSTVSRMQSKSNFPEWSKRRDPQGIAWLKSLDTKLFCPQSNLYKTSSKNR